MNRRSLIKSFACLFTTFTFYFSGSKASNSGFLTSPVRTNRLRPPGAVAEDIFAGKCIRCGRCVEVCPYRSITLIDIRNGVFAGTPLISVEKVPCYLCMKCVDVCPTGSLTPVSQEATRMGLAVINTFTCAAWAGLTLCRTCFDKCPYKGKAIRLEELKPVVDADSCTGCGLCTHACPITTAAGLKAVNIEPLYAGENNKKQ